MLSANISQWLGDEPLATHLERGGVSRREFLEFCGKMTAVLGLSTLATPRIVEAMESLRRPSVVARY